MHCLWVVIRRCLISPQVTAGARTTRRRYGFASADNPGSLLEDYMYSEEGKQIVRQHFLIRTMFSVADGRSHCAP